MFEKLRKVFARPKDTCVSCGTELDNNFYWAECEQCFGHRKTTREEQHDTKSDTVHPFIVSHSTAAGCVAHDTPSSGSTCDSGNSSPGGGC
jgi:hypothetical protein